MIFLDLEDDGKPIQYDDLTKVKHSFKASASGELEVPVFSLREEDIAYTVDDLLDLLDPSNGDVDDAKLILCKANYADPVDPAVWYADVLPDDAQAHDLPGRVQVAFMELNETLESIREVISYMPGSKVPNQKSVQDFLKKHKRETEEDNDDDE